MTGQGESDRSHSQSRSSSSDKVNHRGGGQFRRLGVVSMPPQAGDTEAAKMKAEVARRISLDDLSAAFQGDLSVETSKLQMNVLTFEIKNTHCSVYK